MTVKEWPHRYNLRAWQLEFAQKYLEQQKPRSLLVAAQELVRQLQLCTPRILCGNEKFTDSLIVLNDLSVLREQWKHVASEVGFNLSDTIEEYRKTEHDGLSITVQSLHDNDRIDKLLDIAHDSACFGIVDESHRSNKSITHVVTKVLDANSNNKFLSISGTAPLGEDSFDRQFRFNTEYIFQDSIIRLRETKIQIAHFSPSFSVLQTLLKRKMQIDDLNWREFERLIAELLEQDGYEVELMRGTKDGGVDVVAVKNMGNAGFFKTLWQAKKKYLKNKVGLSVIRELADTRNEFKASKGIIVTSTYLTRDALARVQRDKYILGKVDRNDLNEWVQRMLFK